MKKENFIQKFFKRIQKWYVTLPDKKRYFELLTAILSIPMILTVILVNMSTINKSKESSTPTPTTAPIQVVVENPPKIIYNYFANLRQSRPDFSYISVLFLDIY